MRVSLLTPIAAAVGLVGVIVVWMRVRSARRARDVCRTLGLPAAPRSRVALDLAPIVALTVIVALAAAQPVVSRRAEKKGREGAEVIVVLDITRSMDARRAPSEPTRLDRARAMAKELRFAVPEVRIGLASVTDRVLPHLFPTLGENAFAAVADRAIDIERPPPDRRTRRATALLALGDLGRLAFYRESAAHRVAVVFTDGETLPIDLATLGQRLHDGGVSTLFVQIWRPDEHLFAPDGTVDESYKPDPTAQNALQRATGAVGGLLFSEGEGSELAAAVERAVGAGPAVVQGRELRSVELAPALAAFAFVPLTILLFRRNR
jgi:von Willebrand factor type A domain